MLYIQYFGCVSVDQNLSLFSDRMTWVANELVCEGRHFFLECMRSPPDWHIWMYLLGSEKEAEQFQTNIQLFKEAEYARKEYSAQRSYTGPVCTFDSHTVRMAASRNHD